ncbi:hypothetical protein N7G274_003536 [Stereocaulon virgatum]|uniref:Amine oxidase domain-containing protein n=1 Tax=Stereocaulon virgatum TaxID=373712 RepID=A0ABR4AE13_9LECA
MHILTHSLAFIVLSLDQLSLIAASSDTNQMPMQWSEDGEPKAESAVANTPKIAIIGAGIAGASSAHHLHEFARLHQPLDITVFEVDDQVGGRIRSAYVFGEPCFDVEVGASAFREDDWCLNEAMQEVGLRRDVHVHPRHNVGVWDGNNFIMSCSDKDKPLNRTLWQSLKWRWRYGLSLTKMHAIIQGIADRFSSFAVSHLLLDLPERLHESLTSQGVSFVTTPFLEGCRVNAKLINEVVRAESRYRHARDLDQVNELSSPLVLRSAPNIAVYGGNQRLPHRMLKIAEAHIHLNTRVT